MAPTQTAAGASLFLGAGLFWLVNTVAEASYPGYSVKADALSRLGSIGAPTQGLWDAALLILAASWLVGMTLLFRGSGRRAWLGLNLVPGIAVLLVAIFPAGSIAAVHGVAAYAAFLTSGVVAVADFQFVRSWFRYVSLALGATTLGCLVLGPLLAQTIGFGGTERLVAYPILGWLMGFGSQVMAGSVEVAAARRSGGVDRWLVVAVASSSLFS
jgi:Predicted membrane protein